METGSASAATSDAGVVATPLSVRDDGGGRNTGAGADDRHISPADEPSMLNPTCVPLSSSTTVSVILFLLPLVMSEPESAVPALPALALTTRMMTLLALVSVQELAVPDTDAHAHAHPIPTPADACDADAEGDEWPLG